MAAHPFFAEWRLIGDLGDMRLIVRRSRPALQAPIMARCNAAHLARRGLPESLGPVSR